MAYPYVNSTPAANLHPALHNEVVDLEQEYGLVIGGGATQQQRIDNTTALNQAFSDHLGLDRRLLLPSGAVHIEGAPVGIDVTSDTPAALEIFGYGRRGSRIHQHSAGMPVMRFRTTGGNLRDLYVHDLMLKGESAVADYGLELWKVDYSTFDRLCLWTCAGIYIDSSSVDNNLNELWFLNTSGYAVESRNSTVIITNSVFGEDGGSVLSNGGKLLIFNSYFRDCSEKVTPGGINGMGESLFSARGDGLLTVANCNISMDPTFDNLCNIDNGIARFRDNDIRFPEGNSRIFCVRTFTSPQWLQFLGNSVELLDAAASASMSIVNQFIGTAPHDSIIADNVFMCGTNWTLTNEDTFYTPANNNQWANNVIKNTTGVS